MEITIFIFVFIFGAVIGSFLNCLIWRLHTEETLLNRSYCPKCGKTIVWYDNLPLLSFLFLRGRCRSCGQAISWQYPLIELASALLFLFSFFLYFKEGLSYWYLFRNWFIIAVLLVILVYDLRWQLILDKVTLPSILIVTILNIGLGFSWFNFLISAIIGGSFFLLQFVISRGRWIGGGDIRLGVFMGLALVDISNLLLALFLSYVIGSIIGLSLVILGKKSWGSKVPLGVFLAIGTTISLFWGEEIVTWYLGILG